MNNISVNLVEIRDGDIDEKDFKELIYSSWLRPLYYDNDAFQAINSESYFKKYPIVINRILSLPDIAIRVACLRDDPNVIIGYSVLEPEKLHWVYVKKAWRQLGICKKLIPKGTAIHTHTTDMWGYIEKTSRFKNMVYDPFLF